LSKLYLLNAKKQKKLQKNLIFFHFLIEGAKIMWIEVLKTGNFIDSRGNQQDFSTESLDAIAEKYNSKVTENSAYEAPLVKGHPADNSPAFGWVERLQRNHNFLMAKLKDISEKVLDEMKSKTFRKVSVSLYPDMMLRHIGLLGAATPAVTGLAELSQIQDISFIEYNPEDSIINFNSEEPKESPTNENSLDMDYNMSNIKAKLIELSEENKKLRHQIRISEFREFTDELCEKSSFQLKKYSQDINELLELAELSNNDKLISKFKSLLSKIATINLSEPLNIQSNIEVTNSFDEANVPAEKMNLHKKVLQFISANPQKSYEEALTAVLNY